MPERQDRAIDYRLKLFAFLLGALAILSLFYVAYSAINTISLLNVIEADRDQWQRPNEIIRALDIKSGDVVVDLGCGSGYFSLKLSAPAGKNGRVIAEDIRLLPLAFLWFRAASRREHNVRVVLGTPDDPRLPHSVNSVLISNAYHEFTNAHSILMQIDEALAPRGRLIIVDREPKEGSSASSAAGEHEISAEQVESELRQANFEIVSCQPHFIDHDPYGENWWLITAQKL